MFNRYWRSYPWALRLALALLLVFTLASFSIYIALLLGSRLAGPALKDVSVASTPAVIRTSLLVQTIQALGLYVLPAILFAVFTHPRPRTWLGIRKPGRSLHWLFTLGIALGMIPAIQVGQQWVLEHIHLGSAFDKEQEMNNRIQAAWMSLRGPGYLPLLLGVMALLPAIGEELLFRGVFMRLFHQYFRKRRKEYLAAATGLSDVEPKRGMLLPVFITSVIFTYLHSAPYSYPFIFLAGCVLALVYYYTGSLLLSIFTHFVYNGTQVVLVYLSSQNLDFGFPAWAGIAGLGLFLLSLYALIRTQTPLAANWSADFAPGEDVQQQA